MNGYLSSLQPLLPPVRGMEDCCPLLWVQAYPYVRTLALGGWFGWVPRDRDTERREHDLSKLRGERPNSAFVNEVLVRCPNPEAEVLLGIGPGAAGQVVLRVLGAKGACPFRHEPGQRLETGEAALPAGLAFATRLPGLLERAFSPCTKNVAACPSRAAAPAVRTIEVAGPCRYHRGDEIYPDAAGWAGGLCPDAFHAAYPQALAMYYGGRDTDIVEICCPSADEGGNGVRLSLELGPRLARPAALAVRVATAVAQRLLHPVDPLLRRLALRIKTTRACPYGHAQGDSFLFNLHSTAVLCPAAAYSIYPYARLSPAARSGFHAAGGWERTVCPDFKGAAYSPCANK